MKKVVVLFFLFVSCLLNAQNLGDSVIMTVAGKPVSLGEFMFIAGKNNEVNFSDAKSIEHYATLFKNFKLKVAEAESLGLDTTATCKSELLNYRTQLKKDYLSDKKAEEVVAKAIYDRKKEVLDVSHILFKLPPKTFSKDTLSVYNEAMKAWGRLQNGDDFDALAHALKEEHPEEIVFEHVSPLFPLQMVNTFENAAYHTPVGEFTKPIRTQFGYHIIKVNSKKSNLYSLQIAHIFIGFMHDSVQRSDAEIVPIIEEAYHRAKAGEDFTSLIHAFSDEEAKANSGLFPYFKVAEMIEPIENAAFSLTHIGDVSKPIKSPYGYHVIKLMGKKDLPSFDDEKDQIIELMSKSERNFDLYASFDERLKSEYGYRFFPEAFEELRKLGDDHFPSDELFFEKAKDLTKTLIRINGVDYPQTEFVYYITQYPFSTKTYSGDFMREVFDLFVRDILIGLEETNLEYKYPEFNYLMQEYHDGILLFELSSQTIWNHPVDEQASLETKWIQELTTKYPVVMNKALLKKIKKRR